MKIDVSNKLFQAIVVAIAMVVVGFVGLDIPRATVEDAVTEQFEKNVSTTKKSSDGYLVTYVIDGDTIKVKVNNREDTVRLIGIDTPEVAGSPAGAECYGAEASSFVRGLLSGQIVILQTDSTQAERDRHDRLLAYVTLTDGRDVGEILIREGYAYEYTYDKAYQNKDRYRTAEREARDNERGVWGSCQD